MMMHLISLGRKCNSVVANHAGCPRQHWKSGIEIFWGFGG